MMRTTTSRPSYARTSCGRRPDSGLRSVRPVRLRSFRRPGRHCGEHGRRHASRTKRVDASRLAQVHPGPIFPKRDPALQVVVFPGRAVDRYTNASLLHVAPPIQRSRWPRCCLGGSRSAPRPMPCIMRTSKRKRFVRSVCYRILTEPASCRRATVVNPLDSRVGCVPSISATVRYRVSRAMSRPDPMFPARRTMPACPAV